MIKERLQKLAVELGHPPQAYLYARISREDYKDETNPQHAIESQLSILRRVVSENNLNVYKEKAEIESGVTAEDAQREILELIKSRTINILIIKDWSRFARNRAWAEKMLDYAELFKKTFILYSLSDREGIYDPVARMYWDLNNVFNAQYVRDIVSKMKTAKEENAKQGYYMTRLFGYMRVKKKLYPDTVDPLKPFIVRELHDLFDKGKFKNKHQMLEYCKNKYPQYKFDYTRIDSFFFNKAYKGTVIYGKVKTYKGKIILENTKDEIIEIENSPHITPLIPPALWDKNNLKLRQVTEVYREKSEGMYLFSGKIYCYCGNKIYGNKEYYVCYSVTENKRHRYNKEKIICDWKPKRIEILENYILNKIIEEFNNIEKCNTSLEDEIDSQISLLDKEINHCNKIIKNIKESAKIGIYTPFEAKKELDNINKELFRIEREKKSLLEKKEKKSLDITREEIFKLIIEYSKNNNRVMLKRLLNAYISRIVFYNYFEAEIYTYF